MLKPEIQAEILSLRFGSKWAIRKIARHFGVNRKSVADVIRRRVVNLEVKQSPRKSILDPFKPRILELIRLEPTIQSTVILQRIRELGYLGGYEILKTWVKNQRQIPQRNREAFLRLDFAPGECAQVDWGEFGDVFGDGTKVHCFGMVLCHSRMMYIEFTRSEKFEDFIRCHESAFNFFGGVPRECWYDNLGSAVTERIGGLIRFNSRFMAYMGHHGVRPHACNVARGNEKGRVEDLIKYIRMNFWPGRQFKDFDDLIKQSILWRNQIANQREHRSTRRVVRLLFESEEKPHLNAMNPHAYETDEVFSRVVPPDFHIIYETNRYSVPWTLTGNTLTIRVNPTAIKCFYNERFVCAHQRTYQKNKIITQEAHRVGLLERKPGAAGKEAWQLRAVKNIGPKMSEYIDLLRSGHRSLAKEFSKILALSTVYGNESTHNAVEEILKSGAIGVEALELTLKRLHHPALNKLSPEPIQFTNQKLNRVVPVVDLRRFDALLFESRNSSASDKDKDNGDGEK